MRLCPFRFELLADTRITTPARNSLTRVGRKVWTSPSVQKLTRRMLSEVPAAEGGSDERARNVVIVLAVLIPHKRHVPRGETAVQPDLLGAVHLRPVGGRAVVRRRQRRRPVIRQRQEERLHLERAWAEIPRQNGIPAVGTHCREGILESRQAGEISLPHGRRGHVG